MAKEESAFPLDERNSPADTQWGLTKKEWFAGMEKSSPIDYKLSGTDQETVDKEICEQLVKWRYRMADAMLEASKK